MSDQLTPDSQSFSLGDAVPELVAVAQMLDVGSILEVCARTTGMGYCVVAHVTEERWLACAVLDEVDFGLPVGGELPIKTTLCNEVRQQRAPIAFDHASADERWRDHQTPVTYGLESYIAVPIILADGEFFGTLCAIDPKPAPASRRDIVKMFELFAKLIANFLDGQNRVAKSNAALLDAQQTAELREQFIAVLGHDLRNPLAAISGGARMLSREPHSGKADTILTLMQGSVTRMAGLIDNVLDFARGRLGGGLAATLQPIDLTPLLLQVVAELQSGTVDRVIETDITLPNLVVCDPIRLGQLVSNLLGNALTHGAPDKPIRLFAMCGETLEIAVTNGGAPISQAAIERLFQPFFRGEVRPSQQGLGLGLHIASEIAKAHGGTLTVQSDIHETRFTFAMPFGGA